MFNYTKNKIFFKYFFSYLLLTVILIGSVGFLISMDTTAKIEQNLSEEKSKRLQYLTRQIDATIIEPCEKLLLKYVVESRKFSDGELYYLQTKSFSEELYHVWSLNQRLKNDIITMPFIKSVNIYFPKYDFLVSNETFRKDIKNSPYNTVIEFVNNYISRHSDNKWMVVPAPQGEEEEQEEKLISCIRLLPYALENENRISFVYANIYERSLKKMLADIDIKGDESLLIMDGEDRVVTSLNFDPADYTNLIGILADKRKEKILLSEFKGNKVVILTEGSSINNWKMILVSSMGAFYRRSYEIKERILIFCIIALGLGLIFSILISRRFYLPIKKLVHSFGQGLKDERLDEFIYINNRIIELKQDVALLTGELRNNIYSDLLYGKEVNDPSILMEDPFKYDYFFVVLLKPENDVMKMDGSQYRLVIEALEKYFYLKAVPLERGCFAIIANTDKNEEEIRTIITVEFNDLFLRRNLVFKLGVGERVTGLDMIGISYQDARKAIKYKYLDCGRRLFFYGDIKNLEASFDLVDFDEYISAIKSCDIKKLKNIYLNLTGIIEEYRYSYESIEYTLLQLVSSLNKVVYTLDLQSNIVAYKNFIKIMSESKTVFDTVEWIQNMSESVLSLIHARNNNRSIDIMAKIKEYINGNYAKDLNLDNLSQIFYLNASYISSQFKKAFNMSVVEYITQVRLENAKILLESGNIRIDDVAKKTGYANTTYFIKKFKEKYGYTPNNYKLLDRNQ